MKQAPTVVALFAATAASFAIPGFRTSKQPRIFHQYSIQPCTSCVGDGVTVHDEYAEVAEPEGASASILSWWDNQVTAAEDTLAWLEKIIASAATKGRSSSSSSENPSDGCAAAFSESTTDYIDDVLDTDFIEQKIVKTPIQRAARLPAETLSERKEIRSSDDLEQHYDRFAQYGHRERGDPSKSIYELISSNKHTTRFAKLVDAHTDIKALLSDTSAGNVTLFVPTDRAFERLPKHDGHDGHGDDDDDDDDDDDKKPPAEFVRALLAYHIVPGRFPLRRLKGQQTVGTNLSLSSLGSRPQRVRVSRSAIPFFGPAARLNFYSRVVFGDVVAANGVVHAVDAILVPPPRQAKIVQLLPGTFSTLALALETTGVGEDDLGFAVAKNDNEDDDDAPPRTGGTLFAPTNHAFARLGTRTNAFLFSERGKKYLRALLKYHIVANETLYSDAFYKKKTDYDHDHDHADKNTDSASRDYWHVDLPSQLHGKPISVDIKRWFHVVSIKVNGLVNVVVKDGIAHDGVIHVVDKVLIPQHHRHHPHGDGVVRSSKSCAKEEDDDDAVGLDELKARLEPYLEEDESVGRVDGGYEDSAVK